MRSRARLSYQCNLPDSAFSLVDGKEFCSQCQTSIVDFTVMSDDEIRAYISVRSGSVCVKIDSDQLQRVKSQPSSLKKKLAIAATAAFLAVATESSAQTDSVKTEQTESVPVSQPNVAVELQSDSSAFLKTEEGVTDEPVVKKKPLKKWVYLRTSRWERYVTNRWPFFGKRYIGWRGKF